MDTKGDTEEMTYPYICFMVDNFDEVSIIFNENFFLKIVLPVWVGFFRYSCS